jgi:hypothetical protein
MPFYGSRRDSAGTLGVRTCIEVDKAKVEVIEKLPPPTNVKGIHSFLGHAGFYRCFIKDFSHIARPLTNLLAKDVKFTFNDEFHRAFQILKKALISVQSSNHPTGRYPLRSCVMLATMP